MSYGNRSADPNTAAAYKALDASYQMMDGYIRESRRLAEQLWMPWIGPFMAIASPFIPRIPSQRKDEPSGYSMPTTAPLYGSPPFEYQDSKMALITFETIPEVVRSLVPEPLKPMKSMQFADKWVMTLTLSEFDTVAFGRYKELVLAIPATLGDTYGSYAAYIYLDADSPIAAGREIWGWPKKEALITLGKGNGKGNGNGMFTTGTVERGGIVLAKVDMEWSKEADQELATQLEGLPYSFFNRKLIPSVVKDAAPEVHQLTLTTFGDFNIKQAHYGNAEITFGMSRADPLQAIPVLEVLSAVHMVADSTLPYGTIIHDYLKRR